jgi:hypothetical protein
LAHPGRIIQQGRPWAGYPGQATCRLGRHSSSAPGPVELRPRLGLRSSSPPGGLPAIRLGLPRSSAPGGPTDLTPGWASRPIRPASSSPGWAGSWLVPAGPLHPRLGPGLLSPDWAASPPAGPANQQAAIPSSQPRMHPGRIAFTRKGLSRPELHGPGWDSIISRLGCLNAVSRPGQAEVVLFMAGLATSGPGFTPQRAYNSSGASSSTLCQSWDASRLGLAHSPPSYAGLGTPLGSDQHIHPLLVSLILRRRIRLMTW